MPPVHASELRFEEVDPRRLKAWRRPDLSKCLDRVGAVPIADSELLQTALYLPLALRQHGGGYEVVAVVHPALVARLPVRPDGRWVGYAPMAVRALPFRSGRRGGGKRATLEMAVDLEPETRARELPFFGTQGQTHESFATVSRYLERLESSRVKLAGAAARLVAADLAVRLAFTTHERTIASEASLLTIDQDRLVALSNARTAAMAADGSLALDLATACCFSRRLWAPHLVSPPRSEAVATSTQASSSQLGRLAQGLSSIDLRIDESPLFSSEAFLSAARDEAPCRSPPEPHAFIRSLFIARSKTAPSLVLVTRFPGSNPMG